MFSQCYDFIMNIDQIIKSKYQSPEYKAWSNMHSRTRNTKLREYKYYGGKGIKVCERWKTFKSFYLDMGDKPTSKHTLERIDINKDYSPENCKWATWEEQQKNTSRSRKITLNGKTQILNDWCKELDVPLATIMWRVQNGMSYEDALAKKYNKLKRTAKHIEPNKERIIECFGRKMLVTDWAIELNCSINTLNARLRRGWSSEKVITTPIKKYKFKDK